MLKTGLFSSCAKCAVAANPINLADVLGVMKTFQSLSEEERTKSKYKAPPKKVILNNLNINQIKGLFPKVLTNFLY